MTEETKDVGTLLAEADNLLLVEAGKYSFNWLKGEDGYYYPGVSLKSGDVVTCYTWGPNESAKIGAWLLKSAQRCAIEHDDGQLQFEVAKTIGEAADAILLADAAAGAERVKERIRQSERQNILRLARAASMDDSPEREAELAELTNWILEVKSA